VSLAHAQALDLLARLQIRLLLSSFAVIAADEAIIWVRIFDRKLRKTFVTNRTRTTRFTFWLCPHWRARRRRSYRIRSPKQ